MSSSSNNVEKQASKSLPLGKGRKERLEQRNKNAHKYTNRMIERQPSDRMAHRQRLSRLSERLTHLELSIKQVGLRLAAGSGEDTSQQLADQLATMQLQDHGENDQDISEWLKSMELRLQKTTQDLATIVSQIHSTRLAHQLAAMKLQDHREHEQNSEANSQNQAEKNDTLEEHGKSE